VKPWEARPENAEVLNFIKNPRSEMKHNKLDKPQREKVNFIEAGKK
jgi:hypothetical protein